MKKSILAISFALLSSAVFAVDYSDFTAAISAGKKLEKEKKTEEAIQAYKDAAKITSKPNEQVDALTKAARLLRAQKKGPEAVQLLLPCAENEKTPASIRTMAYLECAKVSTTQEDKLKFYDCGIALKAGDWTEGACYTQKCEIYLKQNKIEEAEAIYKQVVANNGYNDITKAAAYDGLIKIALKKKDFAAAHNYCSQKRELGKKRYVFLETEAVMKEAEIYTAEQKWDEAVKVYQEIAANEKARPKDRANAIEKIVVLEYEKRDNPENAKKALELFKKYNLPMTKKAQKYEKDIKELTE